MKLAEVFKKAIEGGDWSSICDVYFVITGEVISPPDFGQLISGRVEEINLADIEMVSPTPKPEAPDIEIVQNDQTVIKSMGRKGKKRTRQPEGEFIASSKSGVRGSNVKGRQAQPESLAQVGKRKNRFNDNQTIASNELVTKKPKLGVANPSPRGNRNLLDTDSPDTSAKMDVQCSLCQEKFNLSPTLTHGYDKDPEENVWKCNECCTMSGRTKALRQRD